MVNWVLLCGNFLGISNEDWYWGVVYIVFLVMGMYYIVKEEKFIGCCLIRSCFFYVKFVFSLYFYNVGFSYEWG